MRLEREAQGIALRDISEQTRISIRYLEAIELDDYQRLPGGIFNRSFIRAYAKFIGYDEHSALEDYARTLRERGESDDDGSKIHHSRVYTDEEDAHRRSPLKTLLLAIVILAALSLAVWAALHFYQRSVGQKPAGTGRRFSYQGSIAVNSLYHSNVMPTRFANSIIIEEAEHDFTV